MSSTERDSGIPTLAVDTSIPGEETKAPQSQRRAWWKSRKKEEKDVHASSGESDNEEQAERPPERWSLGILNDKKTEEVPGTVLLLSSNRNEPLGLQHAPRTTSASSLPSPYPSQSPSRSRRSTSLPREEKKKTRDGQILLVPQPEDSLNDPLNWPAWRRDLALLSLGFYCMLGGGITPLLAAGYDEIATAFDISTQRVALTTGLYMMGLGLGAVVVSPTAILFGKRPVYLFSAIIFILTAVWCAKSPNFASLVVARVFQGFAVSPVECLPSATIAEIFFLHERAFRIGIYTLLLLGGKNLIPLVSAAIIEAMNWRWVFWVVAMVAGFCWFLLFFLVPETFWDRTPRPKKRRPGMGHRSLSNIIQNSIRRSRISLPEESKLKDEDVMTPRQRKLHRDNFHVGFVEENSNVDATTDANMEANVDGPSERPKLKLLDLPSLAQHQLAARVAPTGEAPITPVLHNLNSPYYADLEKSDDYLSHHPSPEAPQKFPPSPLKEKPSVILEGPEPEGHPAIPPPEPTQDLEKAMSPSGIESEPGPETPLRYTPRLRQSPPKTYAQTLRPWNGRLTHVSWFKVAVRPLILLSYPAIVWSAIIYSCSIGWLIVLSEAMTTIYRSKTTYNFTALQVGLVYISPFIGGILGTAVAGRVSDMIVRFLSRRNGGVYEPEFRLVMAIPILLSTSIGLMGFGWSAKVHDAWIVPTIFFGIISFGCSLGSTTSITFAVDSYRQYAGEALVTLNFSKNIFHGLIWSLFFPEWLTADGSRTVFLSIGGIQIAACLATIPMYIWGKRCRMWTVRRAAMERWK